MVIQPFSGDVLQFIKAGVMEIPDILAINKADDETLARKAMADVKAALSLEQKSWARPVLAVSAATNLNLDKLNSAIAAHHHHLSITKALEQKRAEQAVAWAVGEITYEVGRRGLATLGGPDGVSALWSQPSPTVSEPHRLLALLRQVRYEK
jgi:LAO/AO transport system kinase